MLVLKSNYVSSKIGAYPKMTETDFGRYQSIQRTMATDEEEGSQRLERTPSTETDSDAPPTPTGQLLVQCPHSHLNMQFLFLYC